ncbi:MAG: PqqD family protein [Lentisphaeria bacterium]|nr:PqqD family protein [Lentisphaeria bacterium]
MTINPFAVMQEEFDHSGIVFNPDHNRVMTLNPSGVTLWKAFEKGMSVEQAALELEKEFDVDSATARKDARAFAETLCAKGLLNME